MEKENKLEDIERKLESKPAYKKMLNNLLGITTKDNSVFATGTSDNIDLIKILSEDDYQKIMSNPTFNVPVNNGGVDILIEDLAKTDNYDEFLETADEAGLMISIADRKNLSKDFSEHRDVVLGKIKKRKSHKISKWKKIRNKYLDKQAQTNSWPLYIGAMFVKVKTANAVLYAPLILKKVSIEITASNRVQIKSLDDSVDLNEKLIFLLKNEYEFNIAPLPNDESLNLERAAHLISQNFKTLIGGEPRLAGSFKYMTKKDVKNFEIEYTPGIILTMVSPSGSNLRDKLLDILDKQDPDDLLNIDMLKNMDSDIDKFLESKNGVWRITPTDISQEKAIIGSLKDNSIIWGPPGTGKSQTITNIIANILAEEKTAIVTSEKKAALDVIQRRMGRLGKYMFFGLTNKNVDKELFYRPFQELIDTLTRTIDVSTATPNSFITDSEWKLNEQKSKLANENINDILVVKSVMEENLKLNKNIDEIHSLVNQYPTLFHDFNDFLETRIKNSEFNKKGFIIKKYPKGIRALRKYENVVSNEKLVHSILKVENSENIHKINEYKSVESQMKKQVKTFQSNMEYLDRLLALRFKSKVEELQNNPETKKQINSFLKNCKSGYRIPYKFVSIHKEIITKLFSIFVSTPQTLASTIDMYGRYDYAIFDEASQLHLEKAIPFIAVADKSVIAGDNQQMKPTSYFGVRDNTYMMEDSEENVDSLLDYAYRKGLKSREYMLTKNYRSSSSQLMSFSSKVFYEGKLDVIDSKDQIGYKSIEVIDANGKWEGRINDREAVMSLDKLLEVANEFERIILLTLNSSQRQYIESLIYSVDKYAPIIEMLKNEKVVLRNLENIQGDEGDLVIVSVAYDISARLSATYVARPEGKNALNVAISRASRKMIVFKSIKSADVPGTATNDSVRIFREWLMFLESTQNADNKIIDSYKKAETFDSDFEEDVYDSLLLNVRLPKDVYIVSQYSVGSYKIDLAIISSSDNKFVLGIEVDGYKYHSGFKQTVKDIERQMFIESKGYSPIYRIGELTWKTEKTKVIEEIQKIIKRKMINM